ncbi:MAG: hypothetical protein GXO50_06705 [Chlorobi bacterium]|nr:hypothetical protein [Chlorobiota bacterium]
MKKQIRIILFILLMPVFALGQNPLRTDGTAFTVPVKVLELSLFRPAKYGLTKKDQLSIHPVGTFILPHIFYKRKWVKFELFRQKFIFSSRHGIYYPKPALKINQNLPFDEWKFYPEDADVPSVLALQSEVLLSHYLQEPDHCSAGDYLITARLGFKYGLNFSDFEQPLIYKPVLYRETEVLLPGFVWYAGVQLNGHINFTYNYFADLDYYSYGFTEDWSLEGKIAVSGYSGKHFSGFAGLKFAYSVMPDKNRFALLPVAGISYFIDFRKRRKSGTDLFGRKKPFKHDNSLDRDDKYYEDLEKRENLKDSVN